MSFKPNILQRLIMLAATAFFLYASWLVVTSSYLRGDYAVYVENQDRFCLGLIQSRPASGFMVILCMVLSTLSLLGDFHNIRLFPRREASAQPALPGPNPTAAKETSHVT